MRLTKRFKRVSQCLAALALFGTTEAAEPLLSPTRSFRIPFAVEAPNGTATGKAILFASNNGGKMEVLQRVDAIAGGFDFNAPGDGRYAFAVRMTDASGELVGGDGPVAPELEVIVDTAPPELQFQLAEAAPGEVIVSWICNEANVSLDSLKIEYAEGSDGRWLPVDIPAGPKGQAKIQSKPGNAISVRGIITDAAGNRGSGSGQIVLAENTYNSTSYPETNAATPGNVVQTMPVLNQQNQGLGASPFYGAQQQVQQNPAQPATAFNAAPPVQQPAQTYQQQPVAQLPVRPQAMVQQYQPNYGQYSSASYAPQIITTQHGGGQIVNNRVFDINYEVQDVGPSGVGTVKLFVTENNGQSWFSYGEDVDLRSPFQVDTRGEGTFGFAVRVRNGLGFSDPPPQPGDLPSIVVTVDQTPPVVNFAQPKIVTDGSGRIRLQWNTSDPHPASAAVRLEYAMSATGPWTPIFDWQPDQGRHEIPIQPGMPGTIYYRLLARDSAGNVTTSQAAHPLMIDQHRPTVKLISIQPVSTPINRGY